MNDPWLERWLGLIAERSAGLPVLELGCGTGRDSAVLARAGQRVVGIDRSLLSILLAKLRAPKGSFHRADIRDPFPVGEGQAGVVIASLALHYFPWPETLDLVERIRNTLRAKGVLLCRLNSTQDRHFGAGGGEAVEENFYRVGGQTKRFFDRDAVERLFSKGWKVIGMQEAVIKRYALPKAAWEVVVERHA